MAGIQQFKKQLIAQAAAKMNVAVATVVKKVASDAFKGITDLCPVDTGRARASFAMALGAPSEFLPPPIAAPVLAAHKAAKAAGHSPAAIIPKPDVPQDVLSQIDGTQQVFITSNLDYVTYLEDGTTKMPPVGMVKLTLASIELGLQQKLG